ncbi:MAG: AmmeMemoRadiSam system protein B [Candidatus Micrarchaeota archaeon]|nr:AmmeMemoRadiSam system protein B [Candidatus Micrarchaeota archaeon]
MRGSVFQGMFYPSSRPEIRKFVESSVKDAEIGEDVDGANAYVSPHAGYMYSGGTAAYTYRALMENRKLKDADSIVFVGPNHTGNGRPISVSMEDWETPAGKSLNDRKLSKEIAGSSEYIDVDEEAHSGEHSIEVQLPFLQCLAPEKKVSIICMGDQGLKASRILADAIIKASESTRRNILVIASSDFNHYESAETARRKDMRLLDAAKSLDSAGIISLAGETGDSACGIGPIAVAMLFAKHSGSKRGAVLKYSNSGYATKDYSSVVAYSSIAFV